MLSDSLSEQEDYFIPRDCISLRSFLGLFFLVLFWIFFFALLCFYLFIFSTFPKHRKNINQVFKWRMFLSQAYEIFYSGFARGNVIKSKV